MLRVLLLQALAFTGIIASVSRHPHPKACELLSQNDTNLLITRWKTTLTQTDSDLGNSSKTWDYLLADDFKLVSGSIQTLQQQNVSLSLARSFQISNQPR